jgi:hypothetical protein
MFTCSKHIDLNLPNHIAVVPDSFHKKSYIELIQWGIQNKLKELSLFVCPPKSKLKKEWDSLYKELPQLYCQYQFIKSSNDFPVEPISNNNGMMVRMYVSYGIDELGFGYRKETTGTDPDILICTGGYHDLNNFCMHKLSSTELKFTNVLFEHCDTEVWDDFF